MWPHLNFKYLTAMKMNDCEHKTEGRLTDLQKEYLINLFDGDDADKNFTSL